MTTARIWLVAVAFSLMACLIPIAIASADCSTAGDFGAGAGCAPPGDSSGSGNAESWPPTSVDWPPQLKSNSDSGSDNGKGGDAKSTPIVMPSGQKPPPATAASGSDSTSTSTSAKPIVPVG